MARKEFGRHEAVSAVVPGGGVYRAAIAVKTLEGASAPQFHPVLEGQTFKTATEADVAACAVLLQLADVDDQGQLQWRP
jgi:hypothetical protein